MNNEENIGNFIACTRQEQDPKNWPLNTSGTLTTE